MNFRNRFVGLGAVLAACVLTSLPAPQALAHDSVIGGTVTNGEVLSEFPDEITLEFSGVPKDGFNTFAVTDFDSKEVLFDAEPEIDGRNLTIETPGDLNPGPGEYQVGFQITSSDGHATRGSVVFSVSDGKPSSNPDLKQGSDTQQSQNSGDFGQSQSPLIKIALSLGAVLAALAVIIMLVAKSRGNNKRG